MVVVGAAAAAAVAVVTRVGAFLAVLRVERRRGGERFCGCGCGRGCSLRLLRVGGSIEHMIPKG